MGILTAFSCPCICGGGDLIRWGIVMRGSVGYAIGLGIAGLGCISASGWWGLLLLGILFSVSLYNCVGVSVGIGCSIGIL